jgi:hypothetical protein
MSHRLASLTVAALVAATVVLALLFASAPAALPASAPTDVFSAGRARAHLEHIAAVPHPVGSEAHREVREYLLRTLRELGVRPEVQVTSAINPDLGDHVPGATVHNVIARLEGEEGQKALAITAHYDSVPTAPGAADDGAGVAAMLETLRALKSGPRLRNDILFVFTDAEEMGLLGARAFAHQHPLAERIAVVLNFEARGANGPSLMFQTGADNRWLIEHLARSGAPVLASSLFAEVYRRLPNDTDFSIFLRQGKAGLNIGFIDGFMRYHSRTDDLAHLGLDSLQHHGETMLALARHLGRVELEPAVAGDAVFFNVGPFLVHHPASWAIPIALLALLAWGAALTAGVRRGRLRGSRILLGFGALLAAAVGGAAAVHAAWSVLGALEEGLRVLPQHDAYQNDLFVSGLVALTLAVVAGLQALFLRGARRAELAAGALAGWLVPGLAGAFVASGLSYLFTWPVIFGSLGLWWACRDQEEAPSARTRLLLAASALPALLLWVPQVPNLYVALTLGLAAVVTALVALWLGLLLPQVTAAPVRLGRMLALPALVLSLVLLGLGAWREHFTPDEQRPSSLAYVLDTTSSEAWWLSSDFELDAWASSFLGETPQRRRLDTYFPLFWRSVLVASAPVEPLPAPSVRVEHDETRDGLRLLTLRLASRRQAPLLQIQLGAGTPLQGLSIAGNRLDAATVTSLREHRAGGTLQYWAAPPEGLTLEVAVPAGTPVRLRVADTRFELSTAPGNPGGSRPVDTMPVPFGFAITDQVLVSTAVEY